MNDIINFSFVNLIELAKITFDIDLYYNKYFHFQINV